MREDWPGGLGEARGQQALWWLIEHIAFEVLDFLRIEFYLLDAPFAVVERFKPLPPAVVPLAALPPAHLLCVG